MHLYRVRLYIVAVECVPDYRRAFIYGEIIILQYLHIELFAAEERQRVLGVQPVDADLLLLPFGSMPMHDAFGSGNALVIRKPFFIIATIS